MTQEEIKRLTEKVVSGTATDEEIILYNRICNVAEATGNQPVHISAEEKAELDAALKKAIWRNINTSRVHRMRWNRLTAAAAILILLAGAGYFFWESSRSEQPAVVQQTRQQRFKNDVLPGRQGAILTLSGGQTIILESAANGTLASEGGSQVIKKGNELVYDVHKAGSKVLWNTMTTPPGRQYQLTLADGTQVWLNAGSSITYPTVFTGSERTVHITGEAYFEVAPLRLRSGQKMPFVVHKGAVTVQVLGTHFNINTYDDESALKVTLLEGKVKVVNGQLSMGNEQSAILKPGEQAVLAPDSYRDHSPLTIHHSPDLNEVMAWKNGYFLFSGTDIRPLMRQLSRWYDVDVQYNKEVNELFYAEIPRNTNLSDVLKALELTGKVHFAIDGKKIIVSP
jgi:transmembrane sensor